MLYNLPNKRTSQQRYIVAIGDSIAEHYLLNQKHSYVCSAANRIGGVSWAANGHSGNNTTQLLTFYTADAITPKPSILIVNGGTNDIGSLSHATTVANLKTMVNNAVSDGVKLVVYMPITPASNKDTTSMQAIDAVNTEMTAWMASTHPTHLVVNVNSIVGQFRSGGDPGNFWNFQPDCTTDGLHLSIEGARRIGEAIGDAIIAAVPATNPSGSISAFISKVTEDFGDLTQFNVGNTAVIYENDNTAQFYKPGEGGPLTGLTAGEWYMIHTKTSIDLSEIIYRP